MTVRALGTACGLALAGTAHGCIIIDLCPDDEHETDALGSSEAGSNGTSSGGDTGASSSTGAGSTSTGLGSSSGSDTDPEASTDGGGGMPACGNGLVEPPELCFGPPAHVDAGGGETPAGYVVADFTDDGAPDLVVLSRRTMNAALPAQVDVLASNPVTGLSNVATHYIGDAAEHKGGARPGTHGADYDQDGRVDLAFVDDVQLFGGLQAHLRVWLSQGNGTFTPSFDHAFDPFVPVLSVAGEFTGDDIPDVVTAELDGLHLWAGLGNGALSPPVGPFPPASPSWVRAVDFDADAISDIQVTSPAGGTVILLGQPGGGFVELPSPPCRPSILGHDLDGDDIVDLLCGSDGILSAYLGVGDGTFEPPVLTEFPVFSSPSPVLGDFDGDGVLDALGTGAWDLYIARGLGDGSFGPTTLVVEDLDYDAQWDPGGLGVDFDGDGVGDILHSNANVLFSFDLRLMLSEP